MILRSLIFQSPWHVFNINIFYVHYSPSDRVHVAATCTLFSFPWNVLHKKNCYCYYVCPTKGSTVETFVCQSPSGNKLIANCFHVHSWHFYSRMSNLTWEIYKKYPLPHPTMWIRPTHHLQKQHIWGSF